MNLLKTSIILASNFFFSLLIIISAKHFSLHYRTIADVGTGLTFLHFLFTTIISNIYTDDKKTSGSESLGINSGGSNSNVVINTGSKEEMKTLISKSESNDTDIDINIDTQTTGNDKSLLRYFAIAAAIQGSTIVVSNWSISLNPLSVSQLIKLLQIPSCAVADWFIFGQLRSIYSYLSLAIVVFGEGIFLFLLSGNASSHNTVSLNILGVIVGLIAMLLAVLSITMARTVMKQYDIPTNVFVSNCFLFQSLFMSFFAFFQQLSIIFTLSSLQDSMCVSETIIDYTEASHPHLYYIEFSLVAILSCLFAAGCNWSAALVQSHTSATTFSLLGLCKTIALIFLQDVPFGIYSLLWPFTASQTFFIFVIILGLLFYTLLSLYTSVKNLENRQSALLHLFDFIPSSLITFIHKHSRKLLITLSISFIISLYYSIYLHNSLFPETAFYSTMTNTLPLHKIRCGNEVLNI